LKIVQKLEELPDLTDVKNILFDTETSGLSPYHGDRIAGLVVSPYEDETANFYIPIRQRCYGFDGYENLPLDQVFKWFNQYAVDPAKKWIGHNLKYDLNMLRADGLELAGDLLDSLPLAHVFNGDEFSYEMDALTRRYVPGFQHEAMKAHNEWMEQNTPQFNTEEGKTAKNYSLSPISVIAPYGCEDLDATRRIVQYYCKKDLWGPIENQGFPAWGAKELIQHEMKLVKALAKIEWNGAKIDLNRTRELRDTAVNEIGWLCDQMYKLAGFSFSVSAWTDIWRAFEAAGGKVLYWGLKKEDKTGKQKSQQFTMDQAKSNGRPCWNSVAIMNYLEQYKKDGNVKAYEFVRMYREASQRERLVATNLDVYLKKADANGRVHGQFHQHRTITGRLSSTDPNEQNVAVTKGNADLKAMEGVIGAKDEEALSRQIRKLFIAEDGCALVSTDASQEEYRVAAFLAEDPVLMERYKNDPGTDYHQATCDIVGIDRDLAKTVNFLSLYGGGPTALAAKLCASGKYTTVEQAKAILNRLFEKRPALKKLITKMSDWARRRGYIQNAFGRRCPIPVGLEYVACNYAVQGCCGDLMRNAIVRISEVIEQNKWPVTMILTVHDELVYQIQKNAAAELAPMLAAELCKAPQVGIPLLSDIEVGSNWGELLAFKDWIKKCA
jgi:DNA polymerase-1